MHLRPPTPLPKTNPRQPQGNTFTTLVWKRTGRCSGWMVPVLTCRKITRMQKNGVYTVTANGRKTFLARGLR